MARLEIKEQPVKCFQNTLIYLAIVDVLLCWYIVHWHFVKTYLNVKQHHQNWSRYCSSLQFLRISFPFSRKFYLILEQTSLEEIRRPDKTSRGKLTGVCAGFLFFSFNMLAAWHSSQPVSPAASPVNTDSISGVKLTLEWKRKTEER